VRAAIKQKLDQGAMASGCGGVQGRILHGIGGAGIHVSAAVKQRIRQIRVTEEGGQMKGCPAIAAVGFKQRWVAFDLLHDDRELVRNRGIKYIQRRIEAQEILGDRLLPVIFRQQQSALAGLICGVQQTWIVTQGGLDGAQIAFFYVLLECGYVSHCHAAGTKIWSVLLSSQSRWLM